jgi:alpha-galactosidase
MTNRLRVIPSVTLSLFCVATPLRAQVHYHGNDRPWAQRAKSGPDAEVPGWFYNLGVTGLRAQLVADQPKALLIKYVFPKYPADGHVKIGDFIVGAGGQRFREEHRNGYGEKVFGADGPIAEFAQVLEACQSGDRGGKLALTIQRDGEIKEVLLDVGTKYGSYAATYPTECPKSDKILAELLQYLVDHQKEDGSFGDPGPNTFAPLALLASGDARYLPAVKRNVQNQARLTRAKDLGLVNWYYASAAIVMGEYYLATGEEWVLRELQAVHDRLAKSQYLHMSQINPKAKESHPDSFPKGPKDSHGGWGHNPGFEGYGPIAMITGQAALAYALMDRCGIQINRQNHDAAYDFLKRGTGKNGYVWYGDGPGGGPNAWADMGRTGAAGVANFLSPYPEPVYRERALAHAAVIGKHPQSFPDTHGSPLMGMAYTALGAQVDSDSYRKLMDGNRWWFTMAHCGDGSFYYQPNRDNAGYDSDSRMAASAVVAFIYSIPKRNLAVTGAKRKPKNPPKPTADAKPLKVFILAGQSNMQGHAAISTFDSLADDPKTAPLLKEMRAPDGKPRVCERVWITSVGCQGDAYTDLREQTGKLTIGYGAFGLEGNRIGPEYTFGLTMEDRLGESVLIIKTSWGGRSLHTDFRPPSAGPFAWNEGRLAIHKKRGDDLAKLKDEKVKVTGVYYREMIAHVKKVLKDIKRVVPDYEDKQGYELAGFVWFQGFNDYVGYSEYPDHDKPGGYDLYANLLGHLIRDVRKDLDAPNLPVVIGIMRIDGLKGDKNVPMKHFREAQRKAAAVPEFKGNVFPVETAAFWDDELEALAERREQVYGKLEQEFNKTPKITEAEKEAARTKALDKQFKPEELKRLNAGVSNGGYHYLGAAKIMAPIGKAFAEALVDIEPNK